MTAKKVEVKEDINSITNTAYVQPNCKEIREGAERCEKHGWMK